MMPEEEVTGAPTQRAPLRPFRVLPGGVNAIPDEWYAAAVLIAALLILWAIRRNLGNEPGHVHVGGSAAIIGFLFYLVFTAVTRVGITFAAAGGDRDTSLTRGLGFYA